MVFERSGIGLDLATLGSVISVIGTIENNMFLDHYLAMCIWMWSNPIMALWSWGISSFSISYQGHTIYRKKQYWDGGLSGLALFSTYTFFTVTNFWGLLRLWGMIQI